MSMALETPSPAPTGETQTEEPLIRIGEHWVPAHEAWQKLETATAVTEIIDRFNQRFPELSTPVTREVVPLVRQRLKAIALRMPQRQVIRELGAVATKLLHRHRPEEALAILREQHDQDIDLVGLVALAGEGPYLDSLRKEAREYTANKILPEQTAAIWNDMHRPAPGGGLWNRRKVEMLLQMPTGD